MPKFYVTLKCLHMLEYAYDFFITSIDKSYLILKTCNVVSLLDLEANMCREGKIISYFTATTKRANPVSGSFTWYSI